MGKVIEEIASSDVTKWLDLKKINERAREEKKDAVDALVAAIMDGSILIKDDGTIVQTLKFATGDNKDGVTFLEYQARLKTQALQLSLQGLKLGDGYGIIVSVIAALTKQPKGVIKDLDTEDFKVGQSIASFFL